MTERVNSMMTLLAGKHGSDLEELEISLKSCVITLIIYPELMESFKHDMSDIVPYYQSDVDYLDSSTNTLLKDKNLSIMPLLKIVGKILVNLLSLEYETNEEARIIDEQIAQGVTDKKGNPLDPHMSKAAPPLPRLSIKIDISGVDSEFRTIEAPTAEEIETNWDWSSAYTYKLTNKLQNGGNLTPTQKSNFILADLIARITNATGMGG